MFILILVNVKRKMCHIHFPYAPHFLHEMFEKLIFCFHFLLPLLFSPLWKFSSWIFRLLSYQGTRQEKAFSIREMKNHKLIPRTAQHKEKKQKLIEFELFHFIVQIISNWFYDYECINYSWNRICFRTKLRW